MSEIQKRIHKRLFQLDDVGRALVTALVGRVRRAAWSAFGGRCQDLDGLVDEAVARVAARRRPTDPDLFVLHCLTFIRWGVVADWRRRVDGPSPIGDAADVVDPRTDDDEPGRRAVEVTDAVEALLSALDDRGRVAVRLVYLEGWPQKKVAPVVGLKPKEMSHFLWFRLGVLRGEARRRRLIPPSSRARP
jgi:DNA-directed RNA polymerase specialized sigma24 family protein